MKKFDEELHSCVLCGSPEIFLYHLISDNINIFKCKNCKTQFMNPQYTDEYLKNYYSSYSSDEPKWEEALLYCSDYYLSIIEKYIKTGRLLDIGTGKGYMLSAAKKRKWHAEGYDVDKQWNEMVSKKLNVNLRSGDFNSLNWEAKFDVVIMHHVIEHLKNPVHYLNKIHELLNKDGILFLVLPNINSRSAVIKRMLEKTGMRKSNIGAYYDAVHHLFYYTPATISRCVEGSGFKVIFKKSGHAARPNQFRLKRFYMRNISDWLLWKSTFLVVCRKI
jgi:2-polyprenyl-3-methyl-5-hydroxy-6-metoxy-1,4-benzoquinol methylase